MELIGSEDNLKDVYRLTLKFYKENEGKSAHVPYDAKLRLVALTRQVANGAFKAEDAPPLGTFDVIGRDRRNAWISLGEMSGDDAMRTFVAEVFSNMPLLKPFLEAHKAASQPSSQPSATPPTPPTAAQSAAEAAASDARQQQTAAESARISEEERQRQEEQRRQIQDALNCQTYTQFREYADRQYPNNPDQQAVLVRQLQEQHYYQYMQQIYQQQMEAQAGDTIVSVVQQQNQQQQPLDELSKSDEAEDDDTAALAKGIAAVRLLDNSDHHGHDEEKSNEAEGGHKCSDECGFCAEELVDDVEAASMWTKREIAEFKTSLRGEGGDAIIKVGRGETVTVRVPTHDEGSALFWEFATDSYDIAFGLFFEWCKTDETEVSVHVSDSEDEDLDDEQRDDSNDPENAGASASLVEKGPHTSVIIPIYRRDCHTEVYMGTHAYPGQGVYLLKFDNTYSIFRSKTLYYRVYYTK